MAFPLNFSYASPSNARQLSPGKATIALFVIGIVGAALTIFLGVPMALNALVSKSWPAADGIVTVSEFTSNRDDDGSVTYGASIAYDYNFNDIPLTGSNVHFGQYSSGDPSYGRSIVQKYPVGMQVRVYYDPDDPSTSVLEPGAGWSSFMVGGIGALFALIWFIGGFFQFKKYKRGGGAASSLSTNVPTT